MLVLMCGEVGLVNHRYGKRCKKKVEKESKNDKFAAVDKAEDSRAMYERVQA